MKTCNVCSESLPLAAFHRDSSRKDGRMARCRACQAQYDKTRNQRRERKQAVADRQRGRKRVFTLSARTTEQVLSDRSRLRPGGTKACRRCVTALPLELFSSDMSRPDGLNNLCKSCDGVGLFALARSWWEQHGVTLRCVYCRGPFQHVDHIVPTALGGPNEAWNLLPACASCNTSKSDTPVAEWLHKTGRAYGWGALLAWLITIHSPAASERGC